MYTKSELMPCPSLIQLTGLLDLKTLILLNVHFISNKWEGKCHTLTIILNEIYTDINLANHINSILNELTDTKIAIVTDWMLLAMKYINTKIKSSISCAIHTLQLGIKEDLNDLICRICSTAKKIL